MSPIALEVAYLLSLCLSVAAGASVREALRVLAESDRDVALQCNARQAPGVQYVSVHWYKVQDDQNFGLVTKNLLDGRTQRYKGATREVELVDGSHSIVLSNVTCDDGGVYMCYLDAPVGQQNRQGLVHLTVAGCPVSTTVETLWKLDFSVFFASAMVILTLGLLFLNYGFLKKTIKQRNQIVKKPIHLDAPLKPLDKNDLMLIHTLGPKKPTMKHICV